MKYTMLVSDLDGTILDNHHQLSEPNKQAVQQVLDQGIKFVLCSGRSPVALAHFLKQMKATSDYIVGFNGCVIKDVATGQNLYEKKMDKALIHELIEEISQFDVTIGVYVADDMIHAQRPAEIVGGVDDGGPVKITIHPELKASVVADVYKIILMAPRPALDEVYAHMKDKVVGKCGMVFTNTTLLEFLPLGGNKGEALKILAQRLQIPLSQVVSCGDNYNDLELIETAGLGIAVANGVEPLKAVANRVTKNDNNNHAFAEIVTEILTENGVI